MKMVKSLLLGSAAGVVAMAGAQAADLPVKAHPVQYVKICSLYGAGFYYIPGTDTCIKIGGFVRAEVNFNAGGSFSVQQSGPKSGPLDSTDEFWRTRAGISADARSQTEFGTLRSYVMIATSEDQNQVGYNALPAFSGLGAGTPGGKGLLNVPGMAGTAPYTRLWSNAAFIQWAGFTAGKTGSFFDFDTQGYSNQTNFWGSNYAGGGIDVFAYTAEFGNGLSASISAEQPDARRSSITNTGVASVGWQYANNQVPDIVGNLRIDQSWGSAQVMGAYHDVDGVSTAGASVSQVTASKAAWAVGGGVKFNLPMLGAKDNVIAQVAYTEGAISYVGSNINGGFALTNSNGTVKYAAPAFDAVVTAGNVLNLTKAWSITGGYEHWWNPKWRTSLYGAYGALSYNAAASAILTAGGSVNANWNYTQVGSRTVWTPVENLDLSVEVMYNNLDAAFANIPGNGYGKTDWVSGIFRVQRNFWP